MLEAKDALRGLIDRIALNPTEPDGKLAIHLEGALAEMLILSLGAKNNQGPESNSQAVGCIGELVLVAGGRNRCDLP